jgi:hypothetical protein
MADFLVMDARTPEKMQRAFQMLMRGPGLEIFVPPGGGELSQLSELAKNCMRDYFVERLREHARDDPMRMLKLEDVLRNESGMEERAIEIERELMSIRASNDMDDGQYSIDFATGQHIANPSEESHPVAGAEGGEITPPDMNVAATRAERMAA